MVDQDGFLDALKQQKLSSHQFSCTPSFIFSFVFFLGILCVSIGITLTFYTRLANEFTIDYTDIAMNTTYNFTYDLHGLTGKGDVYVHYQVEGFSQLRLSMRYSYDFNHFAKNEYSFICSGETDEQRKFRNWINHKFPFLLDIVNKLLPPSSNQVNATVPCGERAKFFFNDTVRIIDEDGIEVPFDNKGIARAEDFNYFKNPDDYDKATDKCEVFKNKTTGILIPMTANWTKHICEMEGAMRNEDFIVWMKPAYAPTFRKPWRKLDTARQKNYQTGLPNGTYIIEVVNNWPISMITNGWTGKQEFLFRKKIIITTANWAGGERNFLGCAYLIVGVIILLIGCGLAILQAFFPKPLYIEMLSPRLLLLLLTTSFALGKIWPTRPPYDNDDQLSLPDWLTPSPPYGDHDQPDDSLPDIRIPVNWINHTCGFPMPTATPRPKETFPRWNCMPKWECFPNCKGRSINAPKWSGNKYYYIGDDETFAINSCSCN